MVVVVSENRHQKHQMWQKNLCVFNTCFEAPQHKIANEFQKP